MNVSLLLSRAQQAKRQSGKSILTQVLEIARLRKAYGQIGPSEYFDYGLFDERKHDEGSRQEFVGWNAETLINDQFNKIEWAALSLDKIVFYTFLEGAGIPYPKIQAIFSTSGRFLRETPTFTTPQSLSDYLKSKAVYPIFVKPSHGNFGRGSYFLSHYDQSQDSIVFRDGSQSTSLQFSESLETKLSGGYIFQNVFPPHPVLVEICGPRSCTLRIVVVIDKHGPHLLRAVWKIPTGQNVIDNFQHGRTGNLVASVNVKNGEVQRVIGSGENGEFVEVTTHPDTGKTVSPMTIPDWPAIEDLCLRSALVIPGYRLLHFDIALAESGPALLEVNFRGNMDLLQHASGKGFLSEQLKSALEDQKTMRKEIAEIVQQTLREQEGSSGA